MILFFTLAIKKVFVLNCQCFATFDLTSVECRNTHTTSFFVSGNAEEKKDGN